MNITKEQFDSLPEALKENFTEADDGNYTNGEESAGELKRALERVREEKTGLKSQIEEFEIAKTKEIEAAKAKALKEARETGDFAAIEKDYKERLAAMEAERDEAKNKFQSEKLAAVKNGILDDLGKLSTAPELLKKFIADRVNVEIVDGETLPRILDNEGKPTAASVEDLKKEILDNDSLKSILVGSKGSGSGASGNQGGGGASTGTLKKLAGASPKDIVAHLQAKGVGVEE